MIVAKSRFRHLKQKKKTQKIIHPLSRDWFSSAFVRFDGYTYGDAITSYGNRSDFKSPLDRRFVGKPFKNYYVFCTTSLTNEKYFPDVFFRTRTQEAYDRTTRVLVVETRAENKNVVS